MSDSADGDEGPYHSQVAVCVFHAVNFKNHSFNKGIAAFH